jgi:drug/metabolite transporter (DMT)-like permease
VAILLAGLAAALYGVSDYVGGRVSRRLSPLLLIAIADALSLVALSVIIWRVGDPRPPTVALMWGSAAGLSGVIGVVSLYRALAAGVMAVAAPIAGVVGVAIPVFVGFALGDRPGLAAVIGIVVAVMSVALISGALGVAHVRTSRRVIVLSVVAGAGFGLLFVFYERAGTSGGWWPLVAARATTLPLIVTVLILTIILGRRSEPVTKSASASEPMPPSGFRLDRMGLLTAVSIACLGGGANAAYLASTRYGLLSIVAVVVSMYPAVTVVLAMMFDAERVRRPQIIGLALAGIAIVLVTVGA